MTHFNYTPDWQLRQSPSFLGKHFTLRWVLENWSCQHGTHLSYSGASVIYRKGWAKRISVAITKVRVCFKVESSFSIKMGRPDLRIEKRPERKCQWRILLRLWGKSNQKTSNFASIHFSEFAAAEWRFIECDLRGKSPNYHHDTWQNIIMTR